MAQLVLDCPHCGTKKMAMEATGHFVPPSAAALGFCFNVFATCRQCWNPIAATASLNSGNFRTWDQFEDWVEETCDASENTSLSSLDLKIDIVRTPQGDGAIPGHLPAAAAKAFRAAEATFRNPDAAEVAAMAYRRSIEMALKEKRPDLTGQLHVRIDKLNADGSIPAALKDWAHEVRLIGNDGAHGIDDMHPGDLEAVRGFATAFLQYFITLPAELAERRRAAQKAAKQSP